LTLNICVSNKNKIEIACSIMCSILDALDTHSFGVTMQDFAKVAAQVRGARALLGWSQAYLAEGVNVRRATIVELESGRCEPQASTLSALMNELGAAGILFTDKGIELRSWPLDPYVPAGCATLKKRTRRKYFPRAKAGGM
jgi:DNA-binding XRE family transcriptional regulator